ncbi:MAG TPA: methyl-accepting chemotaxis protein, partial [Rhodocyclaceae bacterium]|nr:methyl-accepting chemotaxis protein [Rhodocyclaceae bacterium]
MKMTISARILLLMATSTAALIFAGAMDITQLLRTRGQLTEMSTTLLPGTIDLYSAAENFQSLQARARHAILNGNAADIPVAEKDIAAERAELEGQLTKYEALAIDDRERVLTKADRAALTVFYVQLDAALGAFRENRMAAAAKILNDSLDEAQLVIDALDAHRGYIQKRTQVASSDAGQVVRSAMTMALCTLLVCLASLTFIGLQTRRRILNSLDQLHSTVLGVEFDLDLRRRAEITANDEVGDTTSAFNKLLATLQRSISATRDSTLKLAEVASHVANTAQNVSTSSAQQSDAVQAMAAGMEEMTVSIQQVSEQAVEANKASQESGRL